MHEGLRRQRGITLAEVLVGIVLVIILVVLFIPPLARSHRQSRIQVCAAQLGVLYKARQASTLPFEPGSKYWSRLENVDPEALHCPLREDHDHDHGPETSATDYWGPLEDPSKRTDDEPIGADAPENHSPSGREGANILLKSGRVVLDNRLSRDSIFGAAFRRGLCIP